MVDILTNKKVLLGLYAVGGLVLLILISGSIAYFTNSPVQGRDVFTQELSEEDQKAFDRMFTVGSLAKLDEEFFLETNTAYYNWAFDLSREVDFVYVGGCDIAPLIARFDPEKEYVFFNDGLNDLRIEAHGVSYGIPPGKAFSVPLDAVNEDVVVGQPLDKSSIGVISYSCSVTGVVDEVGQGLIVLSLF